MALVTEFVIPAESFALADALRAFPEVTVDADRIATHSPDVTLPSFWVSGEVAAFTDAVADDPTIEEVRATADVGDDRLFYVTWEDAVGEVVEDIVDHEGVILEATARADEWRLRIRFMTREQVEEFQSHVDPTGQTFRLERLFEPRRRQHRRGDLSSEQYQALATAAETGYFSVPREASIEDLADRLDISHQAASERLRRATGNLVTDALGD